MRQSPSTLYGNMVLIGSIVRLACYDKQTALLSYTNALSNCMLIVAGQRLYVDSSK